MVKAKVLVKALALVMAQASLYLPTPLTQPQFVYITVVGEAT